MNKKHIILSLAIALGSLTLSAQNDGMNNLRDYFEQYTNPNFPNLKKITVEDIITVQDRLTYVRYEIESYEAILRTYDDQIALSTVSLSVNEVEKETPVEKETFGQEVSRRFKESLESVGDFFRDLGAWLFGSAPEIIVVLVFLGVHVLIVILIVKGIKRRVRKNREKAQKAREAQNNAPKE